MAITFSVDNDRTLAGDQQLTLDETALLQTTTDSSGLANDVDDDVGATYNSTSNELTAALDPAFVTFISNLFTLDAAEDTALSFLAGGRAASSSDTFIQVTA